MTPQETLNWCEQFIDNLVMVNVDAKRRTLGLQAMQTCKSALEKQIPKKPNIHGYREGREINTISYTCPVCNKHIGRENYCKHCGQALDWSDTK